MLKQLEKAIGLGIAGNFANHLEQAGEASDFVNVRVDDEKAPKGLFPFYLPGDFGHFLNRFPLSSEKIVSPPENNKEGNLQIEPEIAILFNITYEDGQVSQLAPRYFFAYNDCSIRKPGAKKISEKKNWGPSTKGISDSWVEIDRFDPEGAIHRYRIASFLERSGELFEYGVDSPIAGYNYFYEPLMKWIIQKMNSQEDDGPLEHIAGYVKKCQYPKNAIISIGATTYTELGKTTFLEPEDRSIVAVYDPSLVPRDELREVVRSGARREGIILLNQLIC